MSTPHLPGQCPRKSALEGTPKCVNCKGDHPANSTSCQHFVDYQQKVQRKRFDRRSAANLDSYLQPAQKRLHQIQNQYLGPPAATWASLVSAAPAPSSFQHPHSSHQQNQIQNKNNVSTNLNRSENTPSNLLATAQATLLSIPGIQEELIQFAKFAADMKAAKNTIDRRHLLLAFLMPDNVN